MSSLQKETDTTLSHGSPLLHKSPPEALNEQLAIDKGLLYPMRTAGWDKNTECSCRCHLNVTKMFPWLAALPLLLQRLEMVNELIIVNEIPVT